MDHIGFKCYYNEKRQKKRTKDQATEFNEWREMKWRKYRINKYVSRFIGII